MEITVGNQAVSRVSSSAGKQGAPNIGSCLWAGTLWSVARCDLLHLGIEAFRSHGQRVVLVCENVRVALLRNDLHCRYLPQAQT